jgi:pSer/pThr/pTyr-binding forkhead associated (FHA) protein
MQLVIQSGPDNGKEFNIGGKPLTIGTDPALEIPVRDAAIAHHHARFENVGGVIYVTDLASGSGTLLNGQLMSPAARYPLRPDDTLRIGSTTFQVKAAPQGAGENPEAGPQTGFLSGTAPAAASNQPEAAPASGSPAFQPYQYQIAAPIIAPPPAAAARPAQPAVQKTRQKINWWSVIAALLVVALLNFGVIYFLNSNNPTTNEASITGPVTRAPVRFTPGPTPLPPTPTADTSGATFKGPTPGIGASTQGTQVQLSPDDLPVYPGARRIESPGGAVYFTEYITTDSFDKLSEWAKTAFTEKGWTNVEVKPLPGKEGAVLTGQKGKLNAVTYLLGPGQKDTAPYDNFFKSANVEPNGALVVINITSS